MYFHFFFLQQESAPKKAKCFICAKYLCLFHVWTTSSLMQSLCTLNAFPTGWVINHIISPFGSHQIHFIRKAARIQHIYTSKFPLLTATVNALDSVEIKENICEVWSDTEEITVLKHQLVMTTFSSFLVWLTRTAPCAARSLLRATAPPSSRACRFCELKVSCWTWCWLSTRSTSRSTEQCWLPVAIISGEPSSWEPKVSVLYCQLEST